MQSPLLGADCNYTTLKKIEYIIEQSKKGIKIAQEYELKLKNNKVSAQWAYKQVKEHINAIRYLKMLKQQEKRV